VLIGFAFSFFPTSSFIDESVEAPYYVVPRSGTEALPTAPEKPPAGPTE